MLLGTYFYSVDDKGRMRMPQNLKSQLGENFVVTKGSNGSLFVFSQNALQTEILEKIKTLPITATEAQKPLRMMLSSAFEVQEDSAGRFLLPQMLRDFAKISKNGALYAKEAINESDSDKFETFPKKDDISDAIVMCHMVAKNDISKAYV